MSEIITEVPLSKPVEQPPAEPAGPIITEVPFAKPAPEEPIPSQPIISEIPTFDTAPASPDATPVFEAPASAVEVAEPVTEAKINFAKRILNKLLHKSTEGPSNT